MFNYLNRFSKDFIKIKKGFLFLKCGILLLPTLPSLAGLMFLFSGIIGTINRTENFFKDKFNMPLIIMALLMIISCIKINLFNNENIYIDFDKSLNWISLLNWLPFFWLFWSLKIYLNSHKNRYICSKYFILGSIPFLISGILQYFFHWYGPFEFFDGLIVWFLKPICAFGGEDICVTGLTGFFSNPNTAGSYLALLMPFSLIFFQISFSKNLKSKSFYGFILFIILVCIFLTTSRNAWLGSLIAFLVLLNNSSIILFLLTLVLILFPFISSNLSIFPENINNTFNELIPYNLRSKFFNFGLDSLSSYPRFTIYNIGFEMILRQPIFGWGATVYSIIYEYKTGIYSAHSHNLLLELAINYGVLVSLTFGFYIFWLITKSYKLINKNKENYYKKVDKAIYCSVIIISIVHLFDIQYFDARISFSFWILLSSLRGMILEYEGSKNNRLKLST